MSRIRDKRIKTEQPGFVIQIESPYLNFWILQEGAPDGSTTTDKRLRRYSRGFQIRAGK